MRRWLARGAVVLALVTGGVAVGTSAQAWSYCDVGIVESQSAIFYPKQGYCGAPVWYANGALNVCQQLSGVYNDWAAAVLSTRGYRLTIFQSGTCSFAYPWKDLAPRTSDPDLYNDNLYKTVSSFKWTVQP